MRVHDFTVKILVTGRPVFLALAFPTFINGLEQCALPATIRADDHIKPFYKTKTPSLAHKTFMLKTQRNLGDHLPAPL
jgi:hypothetical protein